MKSFIEFLNESSHFSYVRNAKDFLRDPVYESTSPDLDKVDEEKYKLDLNEKKRLIELDREYGKLALLFRQVYRAKNVTNIDEEYKKFIDAKNNGKKYFPKLKLEKREIDIDLREESKKLIEKFENLDTYITRFYIEKLNSFISSIDTQEKYKEESEEEEYGKPESKKRGGSFPTKDEYEHALQVLSENPYEKVYFDKRNIPAKEAARQIQKYIDKKGYDFEVKLVKNMLPRMNVTPDAVVRVNPDAHFSSEDIDGLCQHEIEGHVGRRYYGYKTGLMLFIFGLKESNTYDEGLAIWNSLNNVKKPKPNILFNIALKAIITYHLYDKDFCELFDFVKELQPSMSDKTIFKSIVRMKRGVIDCHLYGGALESGYFSGYNYVTAMTDDERDDILRYNIGPGQMKELNCIKKFLEVNKFDPIEMDALKKYSE